MDAIVRLRGDERGASIAVTHVLAIGVTTILVSTLLVGAAGLLDDQRQRAARQELQTIGNRIAHQIVEASVTAGQKAGSAGTNGEVTMTFYVDQPSRVSGGSYSLDYKSTTCKPPSKPPGVTPDTCLELTSTGADVTVQIPVNHPSLDRSTGKSLPTLSISQTGGGELKVKVRP